MFELRNSGAGTVYNTLLLDFLCSSRSSGTRVRAALRLLRDGDAREMADLELRKDAVTAWNALAAVACAARRAAAAAEAAAASAKEAADAARAKEETDARARGKAAADAARAKQLADAARAREEADAAAVAAAATERASKARSDAATSALLASGHEDECIICLDAFCEPLGYIDGCDHCFHKDCIQEYARRFVCACVL